MLKIRNLDAGYGKLRVLKNISLHVDPGEIVTMIGANGAGKTTLLHTIIGLIKPTKGDINFLDTPCCSRSVGQIVASGCALVPENRQVFASMSVEENILLGGHVLQKREASSFPFCVNDAASLPERFPVVSSRCWLWGGR